MQTEQLDCDLDYLEVVCEQQFEFGWQLGIAFFPFDFLPQPDLVPIATEMAAEEVGLSEAP